MELQCKERVDLLEALKKSREDALDEAKAADAPDVGLPLRSKESLLSTTKPSPKNGDRKGSWLGSDTVPPASYEDIPRPSVAPVLPARPTQPSFPSSSSVSKLSSDSEAPRAKSLQSSSMGPPPGASSLAPPSKEPPRQSRTPSPEKKGGMLRTLRAGNPKERTASNKLPASLRGSKAQPAAAKAATQVWPSGGQPKIPSGNADGVSGSASTGSSSSTAATNTWDPYTRSLATSLAAQDRRPSDKSIIRPPSPSDFSRKRSETREAATARTRRDYTPSLPDYPVLNPSGRGFWSKSDDSIETEKQAPPPVPVHSSHRNAESSTPRVSLTSASPAPANAPESPVDSKRLPMPPTLSQLGHAQPISYMKEYPNHPPAKPRKPPEITGKKASNLAAGSSTVSTAADSSADQSRGLSGAGSPRTVQGNTSPMIPRKAVGQGRAAGLVSAIAERQRLDSGQSNLHSRTRAGVGPPSRPSASKSKPENIKSRLLAADGVTPPSSSDESPPEGGHGGQERTLEEEKAWEAKVKHLLQNLPKGVDEAAAKQILNEIVIQGDEVHWSDVAGLEIAKSALKETVVYPFLRPDLFMGLREPARGMLLFGPPGTGKTMLARAVATESKSVFFAISASSLTSKYLGESEKLVRALFVLARALAPSIIFVDEIDSLLGSRGGSSEHEATRRIKTEFLIQWSDLQKAAAGRVDEKNKDAAGDPMRVLVLAATNLPWAIDEAARRRFVRRQYIPLPEDWVRQQQFHNLLATQKHSLDDADLAKLVRLTESKALHASITFCPTSFCAMPSFTLSSLRMSIDNVPRLQRQRHHGAGQGRRHGPTALAGREAAAHVARGHQADRDAGLPGQPDQHPAQCQQAGAERVRRLGQGVR